MSTAGDRAKLGTAAAFGCVGRQTRMLQALPPIDGTAPPPACMHACRAVKEACAAATELRGIGIHQPKIYIVSLYNKQRDLIGQLVDSSAAGTRLRAASDCQVGA